MDEAKRKLLSAKADVDDAIVAAIGFVDAGGDTLNLALEGIMEAFLRAGLDVLELQAQVLLAKDRAAAKTAVH